MSLLQTFQRVRQWKNQSLFGEVMTKLAGVLFWLTVYVCNCVCMSSVTLVLPAKAVGRNEMPFGSDTHVVPSNAGLHLKGRFGGQNPQFVTMLPIAKLLWPFLLLLLLLLWPALATNRRPCSYCTSESTSSPSLPLLPFHSHCYCCCCCCQMNVSP